MIAMTKEEMTLMLMMLIMLISMVVMITMFLPAARVSPPGAMIVMP